MRQYSSWQQKISPLKLDNIDLSILIIPLKRHCLVLVVADSLSEVYLTKYSNLIRAKA